jgi:hypothetical protein
MIEPACKTNARIPTPPRVLQIRVAGSFFFTGLLDSHPARSTVTTSTCAGAIPVLSATLPASLSRARRRSSPPCRLGRIGCLKSNTTGGHKRSTYLRVIG